MNDELKNIELIERYWEGKLSEVERIDFESRLLIDSELKEELDLYKNVVAGIKDAGEEKLRHKLKVADEEIDATKIIPINKKSNFKILAFAASLILLIGLTTIWFFQRGSDMQSLANKYYEKEKGLPMEMGMSNKKMDEVMVNYKNGNYSGMANQLNELLKSNPDNDTLTYFFGIANYELKNYRPTIASFNQIPSSSVFFQKAQFRLILTNLKCGDKKSALNLIDQCLADIECPYNEKLTHLRTELAE